ncbi:hypothetical protein [Pedobacter montanisoli]|uniref:DUF3568 family protein n=1 Tax=Pedobacter montanisoli TaxID=2923277 RepID=A0ABS9ZSD8_9SPHI|nr:hypothetical protein [Pedobacter montanisoli]MCJ0741408.1 hypothetical protein [Pedobacter montanisoli]
MKRISLLAVILPLTLLACNFNEGRRSFKTIKNDNGISFTGLFPEDEDPVLDNYLNKALRSESARVLDHTSERKEIVMPGNGTFYLKHQPGVIEMKILSRENSMQNMQDFERIIKDIRKVLK